MKNLLKKIVKNKKLLALIIIIAVILVIAGLYGTFASNSTVVGSADTYTITLTDERNTLTVPANSSKTVIYQVTNTNKGTVKYGVGYSGDNITVKIYSDSQDEQTGQFDYGDTKFIKLYITNSANVSNEATITSVLGYENGGDLIVPSDVTLVTETYSIPTIASSKITKLFSKTGTVTNNGTTYDIDATHGLIDTSMMYKDLGDSVVVYKGDIDCDGDVTEDESKYILYHTFFGDTDYPLNALVADVNGDGELTDADAVTTQNIAHGESDKVIVSIPKTSYGASNCILSKKVNNEIRYYGQNPNNYIDIGDNVLWRIIGVFDGKLKLIRSTYITANNNTGLSWDTSANTSTTNTGYGINEWSQADIMKLLNPGYTGTGGSLWYNSQSGTCYTGQSNTTTSCNFTNSGLSDSVKDKIADVTWNTGGWNNYSVYPNLIYEKERGTTVISSTSDGITRTTSWTGKIGLAYPSDYGYATDLSQCTSNIGSYNSSTNNYACRGNNWMWYAMTGATSAASSGLKYAWLLTPNSSYARYAWYVVTTGNVYHNRNVSYANAVSPVLYLNSEQVIESGSGTSGDPYVLSD